METKVTKQDLKEMVVYLSQVLKESVGRIENSKQPPNIARCVLATMGELRDIGVWGEERNSTFDLATEASRVYDIAEKKRVEYLAARDAYKRTHNAYVGSEMLLATNLVLKCLEPLRDNVYDPLHWFLPADDIVKQCKANGVTMTVPTLRKYQRLGLIPKPIRLGRKAHYSLLTVFRAVTIDDAKKEGYTLKVIKKGTNRTLKTILESCKNKPHNDKGVFELAYTAMGSLINSKLESSIQENGAYQALMSGEMKKPEEKA